MNANNQPVTNSQPGNSDERFQLFDNLLEGCQLIGFDWKYIYLNHAAEVHNKLPKEALIGQRYMDMWPGIEETEVFSIIKQTLEQRTSAHFENEFIFPDGSLGWFDLSIQPVPEGVFILSIDITDRKIIENTLRQSEEKYRLISDNSDDWIYWVSPNGKLNYVSPACERVTGYTPEEFASHPELQNEIVFDADKERARQHTSISSLDATPHQLEFRIVTKGGEVRWISHGCSPVIGSNGEYLGRRGTNRNITERKRQEELRYESEFKFSRLYENGPFGMVMADKEFRFKKANGIFCSILGYSETELQSYTFKDVSHPDDLAKDLPNIRKLMNKEISVYKTEKRYIRKDGEIIWGSLTVMATYDSEGQFLYNLGIIEDVTRRKLAEMDLEKSRKLLTETEAIGKVGGWEFNIDTFQTTWTEEVYRIHEVDFGFNHDVSEGINFYTPDSKPIIAQAVRRVIEDGEPFNLELEIITAKGNLKQVHTIGKPDLENRRVYGFFQDITEAKLVERELKLSEKRFSTMFSVGSIAKTLVSLDTMTYQFFNQAAEAQFEIRCEDILGKSVEHYDFWVNNEQRLLASETLQHQGFLRDFEFQYKTATGKTGWASGYAELFTINGETFSYNEYADITDRKLAEEKIRGLNERISTATRASQVGIWDWDIKRDLLTWDDQMYAIYGIEKERFTSAYEAWVNGLHPEDKEYGALQTQMALNGEKEYDTEFRVLWPDGSTRYCKAKGEVFRDEKGDPIRMVGINFDITEQKKLDQKIREKDLEFRKLSANVPDLIYQFTRRPDGTYYVPIASEGIWNIFGCTPEEVKEEFGPIGRVIYPEDAERVIRDIEYSAEHLTYFTCEFRVLIPGREIQWIYSRSTPERLPDGSVTWYGFNTDITQRKLAEEAIRYNEALLSEVGRIAHVGGWDFDPATGHSTWTEEVARIHDLDPKTPAAVALSMNFYTEQSRPIIEKAFLEVVSDARPYDLELEIVSAKGNHKWVRTIGHPIVEHGKVVKVQGSFQDITDFKKTLASLRAEEEKLRTIFDVLPFGISLISEDRTIAQMNPVLEKIIKLRYSDIAEGKHKHRKYLRSDGSEMPPKELASLRAIEEKRVIKDIETGIVTENGSVFWTSVSAAPLDVKGLSAVVITQDINDRKYAEEALRESEEKFRKLLENIPLPVTYVSNKGEIIFRNERFLQVIGYTQEEVPTVDEWWEKAYQDETYRNWVIQKWSSVVEQASLTNSDITPFEYDISCKDGLLRTMIVSGITIDDNLLIIFIDITDRKKAEDEIRKLNETLEERVEERTTQLKEANRELEAFSYSVSHDLRAPLRHINGFVDLLNEKYHDLLPEKGRHYLGIISEASIQMGKLIDDLLKFSRTGRQEMQLLTFDLNSLVQEVVQSFKANANTPKIAWQLATLPEIKGDIALLRMVWVNLISNAVKFSSEVDQPSIAIGYTEEEKAYVFFIQDNGAGFDMRFVHKLFGVFQRLHTKQQFEGTGIGLANVKRIILRHGGHVWAESEPNKGATFYFTIPKIEENQK